MVKIKLGEVVRCCTFPSRLMNNERISCVVFAASI